MDGYNVPRTGAGLSVVVGPGSIATSAGLVVYPGGPVQLDPFASTFCYLDQSGALNTTTAGFPNGTIPIFAAITDSSGVIKLADARPSTTSIGTNSSPGSNLDYIPNGVGDGQNVSFQFSFRPDIVCVNGLPQDPTTDYTVVGNNVIFSFPPAQGDKIAALHIH